MERIKTKESTKHYKPTSNETANIHHYGIVNQVREN